MPRPGQPLNSLKFKTRSIENLKANAATFSKGSQEAQDYVIRTVGAGLRDAQEKLTQQRNQLAEDNDCMVVDAVKLRADFDGRSACGKASVDSAARPALPAPGSSVAMILEKAPNTRAAWSGSLRDIESVKREIINYLYRNKAQV